MKQPSLQIALSLAAGLGLALLVWPSEAGAAPTPTPKPKPQPSPTATPRKYPDPKDPSYCPPCGGGVMPPDSQVMLDILSRHRQA